MNQRLSRKRAEDLTGRLLETPEARAKLAEYVMLLDHWASRHNLVRFKSGEELVRRHIEDALAGAQHLSGSGLLLDVGSGAGLPGIPLLIAFPEWRGVLLEPRTKRWAFLRKVVRDLELAATVLKERFQEHRESGEKYDLITARALGNYEDLLAWSRPRLSADGRLLLWLTEDVASKLRPGHGWLVLSSETPALDRGRLVQISPCFT